MKVAIYKSQGVVPFQTREWDVSEAYATNEEAIRVCNAMNWKMVSANCNPGVFTVDVSESQMNLWKLHKQMDICEIPTLVMLSDGIQYHVDPLG